MRLAAFQNPEFYRAQSMRLSTFGKPRVISCAEDLRHHIALPRGLLKEVLELFDSHRIAIKVTDRRFGGVPVQFDFHGERRPTQIEAVKALAASDEGVLCAPTAFGKTAIAASLIALRKVNTLVLVHRRQLMDQWRERLALFLGFAIKDIGQIGGGKNTTRFSSHTESDSKGRGEGHRGRIRPGDRRRMPSRLRFFVRAGAEEGQSKVRGRTNGDPSSQRRPPSNHPYAMRSDPLQCGR